MIDKKLKNLLIKIVGKENIITKKIALEAYSNDASIDHKKPLAVLFPTSTEIVAQIVKVANEYSIALMARGAGTSISGSVIAPNDSLVLVLNKMNKILDINSLDRTALVEAGVINKQLQLVAKKYNLMFAVKPSSQNISTIGGNIAENAGGITSVKYGYTRDHVLGLEIVLSSGEIIQTGSLSSEILADIDLTHLFCGSKGTLGIITKARLALSPIKPSVETMSCAFHSLSDVGKCVEEIIAQGISPRAMEIMDNTIINKVEHYGKLGLARRAAVLLLVEVEGFPTEINMQVSSIMRAFKLYQGYDYKLAKDDTEREELWLARKLVNPALGKSNLTNIAHYIMVPRDRLLTILKKIAIIGDKHQITIGQVAHLGDGSLQTTILYDHKLSEEKQRMKKASDEIIKETLYQGGHLSGEYIRGLEHQSMQSSYNESSLEYMGKIKDAFDPVGLLNPDKNLP